MSVFLNTLAPNKGSNKKSTRVGRGIGSGKGKTCGRGHKGQKSRSGVSVNGFEGGQMPIHRRLPKRGFNNYNRKVFQLVNLSDIENAIEAKRLKAGKVDAEALKKAGLIRDAGEQVKLLAKGEIKQKVEISVNKASDAAVKAIEKAGGKVAIVEAKQATTEKKDSSKEKATKEKVATAKKAAKPAAKSKK
jgi:large subunit ribosomal protein L15